MNNENKQIEVLTARDLLPQRVERIYRQGHKAIPFNLALGVVAFVLFYFLNIPRYILFIWLLALLVISLARIFFTKRMIRLNQWQTASRQLEICFAIGAFFTGCAWAILYLVVMSFDFAYDHTLIVAILAGVSAGSMLSMQGSKLCYYSYILPVLLSIIIHQLLILTIPSLVLGGSAIIFLIFLVILHNYNFNAMLESFRLVAKKEQLTQLLIKANKELEKKNKKIVEISLTDELTKIANRHCFKDRLLSDLIRAKRAEIPVSLLIVDVDYFKNYNDGYGHLSGDECLRKIAGVIDQNVVRESDLAARYGGDELAVILFDTDAVGALKVANTIKEAVANAKILHGFSKISDFVTVSIGISTLIPEKDDHDSCEKLMLMADKALYEAKNKGRNIIVAYDAKIDKKN